MPGFSVDQEPSAPFATYASPTLQIRRALAAGCQQGPAVASLALRSKDAAAKICVFGFLRVLKPLGCAPCMVDGQCLGTPLPLLNSDKPVRIDCLWLLLAVPFPFELLLSLHFSLQLLQSFAFPPHFLCLLLIGALPSLLLAHLL